MPRKQQKHTTTGGETVQGHAEDRAEKKAAEARREYKEREIGVTAKSQADRCA